MTYAITESADERNLPMCKEIAQDLVGAYPGYSWHVRIDGGILTIKNMSISPVWAMVVPFKAISQDAGQRKHKVIMAAGEFLECASLRRGHASVGDFCKALEGRKDKNKFNPLQAVPVE